MNIVFGTFQIIPILQCALLAGTTIADAVVENHVGEIVSGDSRRSFDDRCGQRFD